MSKWFRYLLVAVLIVCLILVRKFETDLFYDPFLKFFQGDFYNNSFPDYDLSKIIIGIVFRYGLNALLSILIIWLIFDNKKYALFTFYAELILFIILLPIYLYMVKTEFHLGENFGFYIRRFLIQPLLLLILIPAFFYLRHHNALQNKS